MLALSLARAGSTTPWLVPGATVGVVLLVVALVTDGRMLGAAIWLGGGTYVAFVVAVETGTDPTAPIVAVLLLLTGELTAWSLDERRGLRADPWLGWRRGAGVASLSFAGLVVSALLVALDAAPASHGLIWTIAGAVAAVGAAGTGIWVARN